MGKKAAGAQPKEPKEAAEQPAKAPAKDPAKTPSKKAKAANFSTTSEPSALSKVRPAPRCIFFFSFAVFCAGVAALYDPCTVKGKRKDCGYPGITPGKCRSIACFLKGGGSIGRKTLKVKRKDGSSLGIALAKNKEGYIVEEVKKGAVQEHNDALPADSQDFIRAGTQILQIDSKEGVALMKEVDKSKNDRTVELEIRSNRVPSFLMWLENKKGKPNMAEKLLTSPGTQRFASTWVFLMKFGGPLWLISGYPLASLPTYMTISAGLSFYMSRCCHNEQVGQGEPHCYKSKTHPLPVVLAEVKETITTLFDKVKKDPRSYFDWLFKPEKGSYSFIF